MTDIYLHTVARMADKYDCGVQVTYPFNEGISAGLISGMLNFGGLVLLVGLAAIPESYDGALITGAWPYNRPCAQQYVGKAQSCMVTSGRLIVHAPVQARCFCAR